MIPADVRIFLCTEPVDLRRSFDSMALAPRGARAPRTGPRQGGLFAFVNRRANRLKLLWFDRNGYCLLYKRLHQALFAAARAPDGVAGGSTGPLSCNCWRASRVRRDAGDRR